MYKYEKREEGKLYMKKLLSIITAMAMIFCFMPPVRSFAADKRTVEYTDYVSVGNNKFIPQTKTAECTVIDSANIISSLTNGQYAVKGDVTIRDRIKISGDVQLILTDGCTLNAEKGINLPESSTLSICGQSGGTGILNANSDGYTSIGGEDGESCGTLNVYGGTVNANSAKNDAAIGGGDSATGTGGNGGTVNVYGGKLNALSDSGTAIGGGSSTGGTGGNGGTVNVYGGTVDANSSYVTAIGGGCSAIGTGGNGCTVNVYGGKLNAVSSRTAIGGGLSTTGAAGSVGQTFISGGSVSAYSKDRIAFDHAPTYGTNYIPKVTYGESDTSTVTKINPEDSVYTSNEYVSINNSSVDVDYVNNRWDGQKVVQSIETASCLKLNKDYLPSELTSGRYALGEDVVINDRIKISGDVQLILTDGCTLNAKKGINLPESSTLSIYGQSGGTGKLNANSDGDTAIGGEYGKSCGTLNVYGGTVNANSTNEAAIGGGDSIDGTSGNGGTVNVYGGTVNAVSDSGTAIGGGDSATGTGGNGGTVNVYGGKLTAGSSNSVAIGGGSSATGPAGNGGTVNVYGGTVDANSTRDTAIGGGCSVKGTAGNGGTVNVYGGKLNAVSSSRAAIGGGLDANRTPGSVGQTFISGGSVSAYSGRDNVAAFDHAPTYGTNYIPKVTYGESDTSTVTKINPENSVYTSNKYVLIEKSNINDDHEQCGHSANTNPTCEGANCSVCGTYIAPTGHKNGDPVTENRTFASCTEGGSYDEVVYCSVCGKEISRETKAIEPSEHTAGKPVIENEAADGTYDEVVYCAVCNAEMSRERKVKAEHKHIEGMADVITMPTFTSAGSRVFRCTLCGEILRSEAIPPITMDFPTNTVSSDNASQVIYTEFPELKFNVEIKDGIAVISWDKVETADRYVIYAIKDGKISEIAKIKKTSFETTHQNGTNYFVRYMKNGVLSPKAKSVIENIVSDKPMVTAISDKNSVTLRWQDMGAEKYNIYKYVDGKAVKIGSVSGTSVKIKNLYADTEYKFIVTAVIDGKETAMMKSDIVTVRTKKI